MKWMYFLIPTVAIAGGIYYAVTPKTAEHGESGVAATEVPVAVDPERSTSAAVGGSNESSNVSSTANKESAQVNTQANDWVEPEDDTVPYDQANPEGALLKHRVTAMQQRRPGKTFDEKEVEAAMQRTSAWKPVSTPSQSLPLKPEEFTDGRQFIEFDPVKLETMMPGDEMTVMIQERGTEYRVKINRIEVHDSERVSWFGNLTGLPDEERYRVSFTRGESLTVGGLETPEGHYVLQAHGEHGWVASSGLLFKVDPNVTDAIVPPEEEGGHEHGHHHDH